MFYESGTAAHAQENVRLSTSVPPYDPPPPWFPPAQRRNHPGYSSYPDAFLPRTVHLKRTRATDALGFNIRGGKEHHCGIFLSKVMPNTEVERLGLKEGDQLLWVNGIYFESIDHPSAVRILKANTEVTMRVRYFPYGYRRTYDREGAVPCQMRNNAVPDVVADVGVVGC